MVEVIPVGSKGLVLGVLGGVLGWAGGLEEVYGAGFLSRFPVVQFCKALCRLNDHRYPFLLV